MVSRWTRVAKAIVRRRLRAGRMRLESLIARRVPIPKLDEAELPEAAFERVKLVLADAARVGRVGP